MFWKAIPKEQWPEDEEHVNYIMDKWVEPFGDMRQELVFIGQNLDKEFVTAQLDKCLLSEEDVLKGQEYWKTLPDPFPTWTQGHAH
jgi:hypothetical protein